MQLSRPRLSSLLPLALVLGGAALVPGSAAGADRWGRPEFVLELRGNYYYELSTRVYEPMVSLDVSLDNPAGRTTVGVDYTLDAVTSASLNFGVMNQDQLVSEYRNEEAVSVSHDTGLFAAGASYRFSKECVYNYLGTGMHSCDYVAGSGSGFVELRLFGDTMLLRAVGSHGHDDVFKRFGGRVVDGKGRLDTWYGGLYWTQILDRTTIFRASYDLMFQDGFQANAYRRVNVAGINLDERHPLMRWRHTGAFALKHRIPELGATLEVGYRYYHDDWKITGQDVDLKTYVDLTPWLELRVGYRFYAQNAAFFWKPSYGGIEDAEDPLFTGDPKLAPFQTHTLGARLELDLDVLHHVPLLRVLSNGWLDFHYDYMFQNNSYGNAHMIGFSLWFKIDP